MLDTYFGRTNMRSMMLGLTVVALFSGHALAASCEGAKADLMTTLENAAAARDTNASDVATRTVVAVHSKRVAEKECGRQETTRFILGLPQRLHSVFGSIRSQT
jgi:hypothetical protein